MSGLVTVLIQVVLAAAWMVWHVHLAVSIARSKLEVPSWWRIAGWIPPLSPALGWLMKLRLTSVVWLLLAGAYVAVTVA